MNIIKLILKFLFNKNNIASITKINSEKVIMVDKNFEKAFQLILTFEGGYINDINDSGGETNKGITKKMYDYYRQLNGLNIQSVKNISDEEVKDIYYKYYWLAGKCDKLPSDISFIHFDTTVNCGVIQAAKLLQKTVNVTEDGIIGNKTLEAISSINLKIILKSYIINRINFYINLVINNQTQIKFLKSWINRTISFI